MDRVAELRAYIEGLADAPVVWGRDDCCAWVAAWILRATGVDVHLPDYRSEGAAARIIARAGGMLDLWTQTLAPIGMFRAVERRPGDIGLVDTTRGPIGVIWVTPEICARRVDPGVSYLQPRAATVIESWDLSSLV